MDEEEFFCGATDLPDNIVKDIISNTESLNLEKLDPSALALPLQQQDLITEEEASALVNESITSQYRCRSLFINYLPHCGPSPSCAFRLYKALLDSSNRTPIGHIILAQKVRLCVLQICALKGTLCSPIIVPNETNIEKRHSVIKEMVRELQIFEIKESQAQQLRHNLGMQCVEDEIEFHKVGEIIEKWAEEKKTSCFPEKVIEALILTEGLGQYVSKLACPWNPPEVLDILVSFGNKILEVVQFLGYPETIIYNNTSITTVAEDLLRTWKIPDCGEHTKYILKKLKNLFIPSEFPFAQQPVKSVSPQKHRSIDLSLSWEMSSDQKLRGSFSAQISNVESIMQTSPPHSDVHTGTTGTVNQEVKKSDATEEIRKSGLELKRVDSHILLEQCRNHNNVAEVKRMLQEGEDLKIQSAQDGSHPLHKAVESGSVEMLNVLLKYCEKKHLQVVRNDHKTPLMLACMLQNTEVVKRLLEHGADPNCKDCDGCGCLHYKETLESAAVITALLQHGATVDIEKDPCHMTPLAQACLFQCEEAVNILLQNGACPNGSEMGALKPLSLGVQHGNMSIVCALLNSHASLEEKNKDGSTALIVACKGNKTEMASKLIKCGADINAYSMNGCSPVFYAVEKRNTELLQILMIEGADLNRAGIIKQQNGTDICISPLSIAAAYGQLEVVQLMVEHKADVNYNAGNNSSPLGCAVIKNHSEVVEYILKLNETQKDLVSLCNILVLAADQQKYHIGRMLLTALGGEKKVLQQARALDDRLEVAVTMLIEGAKQISENEEAAAIGSTSGASATNESTVNQHTYDSIINQQDRLQSEECLDEFVHYCISAFLNDRDRDQFPHNIDDLAVRQFFISYFHNKEFFNVVPLFKAFIEGPSVFIFNSEHFTGEKFAKVLREVGKMTFLHDLQAVLLQYLIQSDSESLDGLDLNGESALKILFGDRFMREVTNQGLLNPQPYTTSGFEMVAPPTSVSTVSIPQNNLDTIAGNTTTVEGNTCSHPPVSSCRVVPAVGNLPEIYVLPVSSRRVVPAVGNLPEIYVLPVSSRRVVPAVGNLPEIYVLPLEKDILPQENQTPEAECLSDTDSTDDRSMNNVSKQQDSLHFTGTKEPSPQTHAKFGHMTFFFSSDSSDSSESQEPVRSTTRLHGIKKESNSQMTPSTNKQLSWMKKSQQSRSHDNYPKQSRNHDNYPKRNNIPVDEWKRSTSYPPAFKSKIPVAIWRSTHNQPKYAKSFKILEKAVEQHKTNNELRRNQHALRKSSKRLESKIPVAIWRSTHNQPKYAKSFEILEKAVEQHKTNNELRRNQHALRKSSKRLGMEDLRTRLNSFPTEAVSNIEEFQCLMKELESTQDKLAIEKKMSLQKSQELDNLIKKLAYVARKCELTYTLSSDQEAMAVNHKSVAQERQSVEEGKSKPMMPKPDTTTDKLQIMQKEVESFQIETVHNNEQLQCMLEMKESVKELESTKDQLHTDICDKSSQIEELQSKIDKMKIQFEELQLQRDALLVSQNSSNIISIADDSGLHVARQNMFQIKGNTLDWGDYGFKMHFPEGTIPPSQVLIKALVGGKFQFPDGMELVSALYVISFPEEYLQPVKLQIQHCVYLKNSRQFKYLSFIAAPLDESVPPYKFEFIEGGNFYTDSQYGMIVRSKFCIMGIGKKINGHHQSEVEEDSSSEENGHTSDTDSENQYTSENIDVKTENDVSTSDSSSEDKDPSSDTDSETHSTTGHGGVNDALNTELHSEDQGASSNTDSETQTQTQSTFGHAKAQSTEIDISNNLSTDVKTENDVSNSDSSSEDKDPSSDTDSETHSTTGHGGVNDALNTELHSEDQGASRNTDSETQTQSTFGHAKAQSTEIDISNNLSIDVKTENDVSNSDSSSEDKDPSGVNDALNTELHSEDQGTSRNTDSETQTQSTSGHAKAQSTEIDIPNTDDNIGEIVHLKYKQETNEKKLRDSHVPHNIYTAGIYYERKGSNRWLMMFMVVQNIKVFLQYIKDNHHSAVKDEFIRFSFLDTVAGYIELDSVGMTQNVCKGWNIEPHKEPLIVRKHDADLFGSNDLPIPPSCLISVWAKISCNPEERLRHPVTLNGIDSDTKKIYISRFLDSTESIIHKTRDSQDGDISPHYTAISTSHTASSLSEGSETDQFNHVCHCVLGIDDLNAVFRKCKDFTEDWKFIGLELGIKKTTLDSIKKDCDNVKEMMLEMLASWLKRRSKKQPVPSWNILLTTLSEYDRIKTTQIAAKIVCKCNIVN